MSSAVSAPPGFDANDLLNACGRELYALVAADFFVTSPAHVRRRLADALPTR